MRGRRWRVVVAGGLAGLLASGTAPTPVGALRLGPSPSGGLPDQSHEVGNRPEAPRRKPSLGTLPTPSPEPTAPRARWGPRIDELVVERTTSVAVGVVGEFLYRLRARVPRPPASNQKLLASMALLEELGPGFRVSTVAAGESPVRDGVLHGDLWILGRGDPEVDRGRLRLLAAEIHQAGVRVVQGSVKGARGFFRPDWWAPGWQPFHPGAYIALPTALTFEGNRDVGRGGPQPERRAAAALRAELGALGIRVKGPAGAGRPAEDLVRVAAIRSPPLADLLARQNLESSNFHAEVLTKLLGARTSGGPGTLATGAQAIEEYARGLGVPIVAHDGSGLSYRNRITAAGMVRLLWDAEGEPWSRALRQTLPRPGRGTLGGRLAGLRVRAKTGTITIASALSGWVWLARRDRWAAFSILSTGMPKHEAASLEEAILRIVAGRA